MPKEVSSGLQRAEIKSHLVLLSQDEQLEHPINVLINNSRNFTAYHPTFPTPDFERPASHLVAKLKG